MKKVLLGKLLEAVQSIMPITALVAVLAFTLTPADGWQIAIFLSGALLLIIGTVIFTLGADIAMMPMGHSVGAFLAKSKKKFYPIVAIVVLIIGFVITVAEPDLHVLAKQASESGTNLTLLISVAAGVGLLFSVSVFKTFFDVKITYLLLGSYTIVFILAIVLYFVNPEFLAISFDSGSVTTGPMTVPFLMSFGLGVAAVRGKKDNKNDDSFGVLALCSVGPIIAVMVLGLFDKSGLNVETIVTGGVDSLPLFFRQFGNGILESMVEVGIALVPIVVVFFLFQITSLRLPKAQVIKIIVGIVYTYVGLCIFLTGVNVGFMPLGKILGYELALKSYNWILIPLGGLFGALLVLAEPAIHILNKQVEEVSGGTISRKAMLVFLCIAVALAVCFSMIRVLYDISIWWFIGPFYAISLLLMFFVPPIFTGIAFDSGGVASGTMTAAFLLPLAIGVSEALSGGDVNYIFMNAFGILAFVAMMPLFTIQMLGLVFKLKSAVVSRKSRLILATDSVVLDDISQDVGEEETLEFVDDNYESHSLDEDEDFDE